MLVSGRTDVLPPDVLIVCLSALVCGRTVVLPLLGADHVLDWSVVGLVSLPSCFGQTMCLSALVSCRTVVLPILSVYHVSGRTGVLPLDG